MPNIVTQKYNWRCRDDLAPALGLAVNERLELSGRARHRDDTGVLQPFGDRRVGVDGGDEMGQLAGDFARRAGRRVERDPGRNVAQLRHARGLGERWQIGQLAQQPVA
jgi:hypothetical protein